jgi:ComF family protein
VDFASNELYKRLRRDEELMGTDYSDFIITNVPRNLKTKNLYGFDHAAVLAESLAELMDVRYEKLLKRSLGGKPQKKLDESKRLENVKGRFRAANVDIRGARIVLIEDVMTTGATAAECARILKQGGATEIIFLTLARTASKRKQKV